MSCCFPQNLPEDYKPFPALSVKDKENSQVIDLTKQLAQVKERYLDIPSSYKAYTCARVIIIAIIVVGIAVGILASNGSLINFPEKFTLFLQNINWTYLGVGACLFTLLSIGASVMIYKAIHKKDSITQTTISKLKGDDHWISASYLIQDKEGLPIPGYIDVSTLDENRTGTAFMYAYKDEQNHYSVCAAVTLLTPIHMIGAIVYNALRTVVIPFFILGCMVREKAQGTKINPEDRFYSLKDIPQEMINSLRRVIKAPFYALAVIFAALFAFFDPLNGRKLGALLEREWNEGMTRVEGFWSIGGPQSLFACEGGGSPSTLGRNGFFIAGCWQPMAVVSYKKGEIIKATSLTKALNSQRGRIYTILTQSILIQQHNTLIDQVRKLVSQSE